MSEQKELRLFSDNAGGQVLKASVIGDGIVLEMPTPRVRIDREQARKLADWLFAAGNGSEGK